VAALCLPTPASPASDDALVARLASGDREPAMAALQERYGRAILGFVRRRLGDDHLAEDVVQEVFARVFRKHHLYRLGTSFRAWLFEIARNETRTALRALRQRPAILSALAAPGPLETRGVTDAAHALEIDELFAVFDRACRRLPKHYAEAFELCGRRGLTYQQAADRLGVPIGTIGIRILRARKRLFRSLAPYLGRLRRPPACAQ
jgi:RNA polymerase sigma-70 factor (ECF subfamily)